MSEIVRRELPLLILSIVILIGLFQYFIAIPLLKDIAGILRNWSIIMMSIAAGVGITNLVRQYTNEVIHKEAYWYLNIYTFFLIVITVIFGLQIPLGTNPVYIWIISNLYMPTDATVYAMTAFDIIGAFYTAFKIRNKEAAVLLVCCVLIMLKNAPIGAAVWYPIEDIGRWLYDFPSAGGSMGITLVAAVGVLSFGYRVITHKETSIVGVIEESGMSARE